jgi:hypothetical protein
MISDQLIFQLVQVAERSDSGPYDEVPSLTQIQESYTSSLDGWPFRNGASPATGTGPTGSDEQHCNSRLFVSAR